MRKLIFSAGAAIIAGACSTPKPTPPNILFIMMDDFGYAHFAPDNDTLTTGDFDPYFVSLVKNPIPPDEVIINHHPNNQIQPYSPEEALEFSKTATPTLTMLAKKGAMFTSAYSCNSLCAPSRLGIATGMYPAYSGVYENSDLENRGLNPNSHLAEKLHELGYATAHIGKWHIGKRNNQIFKDALTRNGLPAGTTRNDINLKYPNIAKEISDSGFYGSQIEATNPLQNGFDYFFGYKL